MNTKRHQIASPRTPESPLAEAPCLYQWDSLDIWDSRDYHPQEAFARLHDEVSNAHGWMPSLPARNKPWESRIEIRKMDKGYVGRQRHLGLKTHSPFSEEKLEFTGGYWCLAGPLHIVRGDTVQTVEAGDLVINPSHPASIAMPHVCEAIGFVVPKAIWQAEQGHGSPPHDFVIKRKDVSLPLRSCLTFLADRLLHEQDEINAIFEAVFNLLPLNMQSMNTHCSLPSGREDRLFSEILLFVNNDLNNPDLSARSVAEIFDISERHLYRIFAEHGSKFGSYVRDQRLRKVATELSIKRHAKITDVAYKWGFSDLSTFTRAFRGTYGCTAREFRKRA